VAAAAAAVAAAAAAPVAGAAAVLVDVDDESASDDDSLVGGFSFSPYNTPTQNTQHFSISTMPLSHIISTHNSLPLFSTLEHHSRRILWQCNFALCVCKSQ